MNGYVAECVRPSGRVGESRKCYNSFERLSIEVLASDQIVIKDDKSESNA